MSEALREVIGRTAAQLTLFGIGAFIASNLFPKKAREKRGNQDQ